MKRFLLVLLMVMFTAVPVKAADNIRVIESYTSEDMVVLFAEEINMERELTVQIGTDGNAENIEMKRLKDEKVPMKTLILIDNSASVKNKNREKSLEVIGALIADRVPGELVRIATVGTEVTYLTEYTSEYSELKNALDSIEYEKQDSYLYSAIYEELSTEQVFSDGVFRRIVVVSDGTDEQKVGFTSEEISQALKANNVAIYAIGCTTKSNSEALEKLFALARQSNGKYYNVSDMENVLDIVSEIKKDSELTKIIIKPSESVMDGSVKTIRLDNDERNVLIDLRMPMRALNPEDETDGEAKENGSLDTEAEDNGENDDADAGTEDGETAEEEEGFFDKNFEMIVGILAGTIVILLAAILIQRIRQRGKGFEKAEKRHGEQENNKGAVQKKKNTPQKNSGSTVCMWNDAAPKIIRLTDIDNTSRAFRKTITDSLIVGRSSENCDIVIDYDKAVSLRHCRLMYIKEKFYLEDLKSSNGTKLNGMKLEQTSEIHSGDVITLGRIKMRFEVLS